MGTKMQFGALVDNQLDFSTMSLVDAGVENCDCDCDCDAGDIDNY